MLHVVDANAKA